MEAFADIPLISTIKERCRVCYTCVRECPAKAIRIRGGQAMVLEERCIGCGNCVRVCSQRAKQFRRCTEVVQRLFEKGRKVAAILAPSFPAEFPDLPGERVVGLLRRLGFASVHETGFGADLVAERYHRLLEANPDKRFIGTTCPVVVGYVERYRPSLVGTLAPIVSPMVATARVLHQLHGPELKVVFIGPCIAKKREALSRAVAGEVASVLTFLELREMVREAGLHPMEVEPSDFDPPHAGRGLLFPIAGGLLEAARLDQSIAHGNVVSAEGRSDCMQAIEEFEKGFVGPGLLEVLSCRGCVMGPGMSSRAPLFSRRSTVAASVRERLAKLDEKAYREAMERFAELDLSRAFHPYDQRLDSPTPGELTEILARMGKLRLQDELNCGACGYETCREHAAAIHAGLAESEMCLPYTIDQLRRAVSELAVSNGRLASAQEALAHAEKLASMGQLAAGIAHEVNNPLGVVLMYAHLMLDELAADSRQREDVAMIVEQADRCKRIVAGLLNFARQNKLILQRIDVRALMKSAGQTLHAPPGVEVRQEHEGEPWAELDRDQMAQVLNNLIQNAYDAMPSGGTLELLTGGDAERVWFKVRDTGVGIPPANLTKVFEPFFTTKPIGKGTGLGLAVTYGIVKMHRGDIKAESNAEPAQGPTGTTFTVTVPRGLEGRVSK